MTLLNKLMMLGWKVLRQAQPCCPVIGQRHQQRVKLLPQLLDDGGQRIAEVAVFALTKTVTGHDHLTAKGGLMGIKGSEGIAAEVIQYAGEDGKAALIQLL